MGSWSNPNQRSLKPQTLNPEPINPETQTPKAPNCGHFRVFSGIAGLGCSPNLEATDLEFGV